MGDQRTIVFGLDGGHFELINPWINEGELPNIERAIDRGVTADLQSVLPPVTSPNWKAYATGKNPGKLGIFWWENVDMADHRVYYPSDRKNKHEEFWEIIGEESSAGVVNVPTTYPPRKVDPFIIAGAPDADESEFTHPPELEKELQEELEYRITKETPLRTDLSTATNEILDLIDLRFETGKYLLDRYEPEFLQITTFYLNSLHHFHWDNKPTLEGWKIVDRHLRDFLDSGDNVILMSDHGANEIKTVFHINTWLEQEGYLTIESGTSDLLQRAGITTDTLLSLTSQLGVRKFASKVAPRWVTNRIPNETGEFQKKQKAANINWSDTVALASGQGPVYLAPDAKNDEQLKDEIIDKLSELRGPDGQPIATTVYEAADIYEGPYMEEAPDIVIDQAPGVHIQGTAGRDELFTRPMKDDWMGENKRDGLFVAIGPDFGSGSVSDLSILDLAPTLLHLHGRSVPEDMDGKVKTTVFAEESQAAKREVTRMTHNSRQQEINRIREAAQKHCNHI